MLSRPGAAQATLLLLLLNLMGWMVGGSRRLVRTGSGSHLARLAQGFQHVDLPHLGENVLALLVLGLGVMRREEGMVLLLAYMLGSLIGLGGLGGAHGSVGASAGLSAWVGLLASARPEGCGRRTAFLAAAAGVWWTCAACTRAAGGGGRDARAHARGFFVGVALGLALSPAQKVPST